MVTPYPAFRPIRLDNKPLFDAAFRANPPRISEFTFTNLYAWRDTYRLNVSTLDDIILLRSEGGPAQRYFNPIGASDTKETITRILKDTKASFIRIPEEIKELFDKDNDFKVEPDPDNWDYLFKTEDLVRLPGARYDGKRNLIKKFKSENEYEYIKLSGENAAACLEFQEAWCSIKDCKNIESLNNEVRAAGEMIKNFTALGIVGGAIKIKMRIRAIALAERLNQDAMVMHILKADPNIKGLYQTIMQEFLLREAGGFKYVNLEQDLGVEGLRKSKFSYHPLKMIKKYTISLAI